MTSCVSSMRSALETGFLRSGTAFFGPENGYFQSATVALHWRYDGFALALGGNRH